MSTERKALFCQDSSFPNRCSSLPLWQLCLRYFLLSCSPFPLTHSFTCSLFFSLFPHLSNGSLCLTRYVMRVYSGLNLLPYACSTHCVSSVVFESCSSVCELLVTSDIISVISSKQHRCVEHMKHCVVPPKGHETWGRLWMN